jgi:serine/threonine-protein kinase
VGITSSNPTRRDRLDSESFEDADDLPDDLLGVTLHDTYVIRRRIGQGGMGRVYEAHHTRIAGKRFAIKVLRAEMMHSPEIRARFQREAEAAASIEHPNVIGVHDFGYAEDGRPYLVSDYLEGTDLSDFVEDRGRLDIGTAVHICREVCKGLEAAHVRGVIHRDLKPENIFLLGPAERPQVKVLDFGLSRFMVASTGNAVTRTGVVMGTPSYMAPEQARGERVDHRVDIYGVGVLLYVALTGRPPFAEESPQQTVLAVLSKEPVRPRQYAPGIPEQLELVVQRAMARNPVERFATMAEVDAALSIFDLQDRTEAPPRAQLLSRVGSSDEVEVGSARTQVVLLLVLMVLFVLLALVTALTGTPDLLGVRQLSVTEFALAMGAVIGTVLTPLFLVLRVLRRRMWNNSVRMVELVPRLRGPLLTAAAVYGGAMLFGRALDGLATQFARPEIGPIVTGWPGWGPVVTAVALLAAVAVAMRRRILETGTGVVRRAFAGAVLGLALVASFALVQFGFAARGAVPVVVAPGTVAATATGPVAVPPSVPSAGAVAPAPSAAGASVAPPPNVSMARPEELAQAVPKGAYALLELRGRYPRDPAVLEPLALALAKDPKGEGQALKVLDTLYEVAPHKVLDEQLTAIVVRAAQAQTETAPHALDLMATRMGVRGADLLYELLVNQPALKVAVRERLDALKRKPGLSPELDIAYELRTARECKDRLPLLDRAVTLGDARSFAVLKMLSSKTRRGCGWKKTQPCPAPCPVEAMRFERAATQLQNRLSAAAAPKR